MASVATEKWTRRRALREERRAVAARRDLAADGVGLAGHALDLLRRLGVRAGDTVTLYESLPVEPATGALTAALHAAGIRVLMPVTEPDFDLDWFDAADPARRPLGREAVREVRVALVPGLGVDRTGVRLGQGGGCYDRALPRLAPGTPRVVLLHPGEVHDDALPRDAHDEPVTHWLTADGWGEVAEGVGDGRAGRDDG